MLRLDITNDHLPLTKIKECQLGKVTKILKEIGHIREIQITDHSNNNHTEMLTPQINKTIIIIDDQQLHKILRELT